MKTMMSVLENINPESVTNNYSSIQSIIDNKRPVGTIALAKDEKFENNTIGEILHKNNINAASIPNNKYLWVIFKEENRNKAEALVKLYYENGGYIRPDAPDHVKYTEGKLLGYPDKDIIEFIHKKYGA